MIFSLVLSLSNLLSAPNIHYTKGHSRKGISILLPVCLSLHVKWLGQIRSLLNSSAADMNLDPDIMSCGKDFLLENQWNACRKVPSERSFTASKWTA